MSCPKTCINNNSLVIYCNFYSKYPIGYLYGVKYVFHCIFNPISVFASFSLKDHKFKKTPKIVKSTNNLKVQKQIQHDNPFNLNEK